MNLVTMINKSLVLFLLSWSSFVFAEQHKISVTHKLISITSQNGYADIVFELTMSNNSLEKYNSVKLVPRSEDIIGDAIDRTIEVGNLPVSGLYKSYWTYSTWANIDSLSIAPILVFDLHAKRTINTNINFPVYSTIAGEM